MATKLMSVCLAMDVVSALSVSGRLTEVGNLRSKHVSSNITFQCNIAECGCAPYTGGEAWCSDTTSKMKSTFCAASADNCAVCKGISCSVGSTPSQSLIICPFLGAMIQDGFLPVKDSYTREELQSLTETAGLPSSVAQLHTASNFKDIPSGIIDIFNMEGLPNEHKTSTGIHDCATLYHDCKHSNGIYTCESEVDIVGFKSCQAALPNSVKFEDFWSVADANSDNILTRAELEAGDEFYSVVDANPIASGDIVGSFGFILDIFGSGGAISKQDLQRVFIERRSPSHYVFGSANTSVVLRERPMRNP